MLVFPCGGLWQAAFGRRIYVTSHLALAGIVQCLGHGAEKLGGSRLRLRGSASERTAAGPSEAASLRGTEVKLAVQQFRRVRPPEERPGRDRIELQPWGARFG